MILLIRHAQSEGNKNRDIHQYIPDHRVKLTPEGILQAEEAGKRLRSMLKPDDTIQFFTSPYRRTRETTNAILTTLTSDHPSQGPSPFPRHKITVYEEPRLREQDFGNFQPCSNEMERMWQERADYGHFFYRIPDGESAADAYDRVSGFNESLWRQFGDPDFPSVCVLVTHGLMTRIFLMKWYHWSVEYFEDLRNVNHCEFIVMKKEDNGKYVLQNELRTWSDFARQREASKGKDGGITSSTTPKPIRKWGGCVDGCDHKKFHMPHRPKRQNTLDESTLAKGAANEKEDHPAGTGGGGADVEDATAPLRNKSKSSKLLGSTASPAKTQDTGTTTSTSTNNNENTHPTPSSSSAANSSTDAVNIPHHHHSETADSSRDASDEEQDDKSSSPTSNSPRKPHNLAAHRLQRANRGGGLKGGGGSHQANYLSNSDEADESDYFDTNIHQMQKRMSHSVETPPSRLSQVDEVSNNNGQSSNSCTSLTSNSSRTSLHKRGSSSKLTRKNSATKLEREREKEEEKEKEKQWKMDSGMMSNHKRADALGDVDEDGDEDEDEDEGEGEDEEIEKVVEELKEKDRKSFNEVY
ncbi:phosphoglycerate mutase-like protein [Tothia fuscella]|uniref:Phosphoglycerate mutase-like protein n=1 Tax=Tothia fuscella TaxID=1048955 RepID=A0A9P4NR60_9PEZI|nr:phosphoglycerate mutase-like protein [Tothia fuscella]